MNERFYFVAKVVGLLTLEWRGEMGRGLTASLNPQRAEGNPRLA